MRFLKSLSLLVLFSALTFAQAPTSASGAASDSTVSDELKKMQDALATQQKQIALQQQEIEALRGQLANQNQPHVEDASMRTLDPDGNPVAVAQGNQLTEPAKSDKGPLSFRIGAAEFTPGGFMDFTNVFRTTNTGNPIGTNFGSVPFSNTVAGHLTEFRSTAQHSRLSLKITTNYHENKIIGYVEADFNGNDPTNVFVSSNSHTNRLRLFWMDLRHDKWEILGGQSWSLITPNRVGISPDPGDVFNTRNMDPNYQVGLAWARQAGFRLGYHPNEHWALALGVENPEQFTAGETTFPTTFNAQLGAQLDNGTIPGTPNVHPDITTKIAYDTDFAGGRHFHGEVGGLLTTVKITDLENPFGFSSHSTTGGAGSGAILVDLFKQLKFVGTGFYSYGGGRYLFGLGPQAVVRPVVNTGPFLATNPFALQTSLVHSGGSVLGFEAPVSKSITLAGYYGGAYFQRNSFPDITSTTTLLTPISCNGLHGTFQTKPCVGFGGQNSANNNNRLMQEGTFDWIQTFFKDPQYGTLQLIMQYSYVTRAPWFVAAGAPKNAHLSMGYVNLRYILP